MSWSAVQATAEKFSAIGFLIQQTHVILMLFKKFSFTFSGTCKFEAPAVYLATMQAYLFFGQLDQNANLVLPVPCSIVQQSDDF